MVALEHDWAGLVNVLIKFAPGRFGALDIVMNFHAVQSNRDLVSNNSCFAGLPFVAGFGNEFVGRFEIVNGPVSVDGCFGTSVVAKNLDLLAAAQIEPAVGIVGHHIFKLNRKIPKFLIRNQIVTVKFFVGRVFKNTFFNRPTIPAIGMAKMPAGKIFAIEERAKTVLIGGESAQAGDR